MSHNENSPTHSIDESVSLLHDAGTQDHHVDTVVIVDLGSPHSQLLTRRVRELGVFAELLPPTAEWTDVEPLNPKAIILSGDGFGTDNPSLPAWVLERELPTLGICSGMQLLAQALGASAQPTDTPTAEQALINVEPIGDAEVLFEGVPTTFNARLANTDHIAEMPEGFDILAWSSVLPVVAMGNGRLIGVQFHPELNSTEYGTDIIRNFLMNIAGCTANWNAQSFIDAAIQDIREKVGDARVLLGLSGGVDSSVAAVLIHKAIGDQLTPVFVNHGLLREGEADIVQETFTKSFPMNLVYVDASEQFLSKLVGVTDPERKRKIIGETFIRVFEQAAKDAGEFEFLAQGTIYPDVIESISVGSGVKVKSHHNVGGLPDDLDFKLLEPFRLLFKEEVREVGRLLGVPTEIVERQPFPGPGLAVRLLGEITEPDLAILRKADAIVREEIESAGLNETIWQYFAILLPVQSTGKVDEARVYGKTCVIRAVETQDAMTAEWARIPYDVLGKMSIRIVNEVAGINRVVYDITTKPPATIEWE